MDAMLTEMAAGLSLMLPQSMLPSQARSFISSRLETLRSSDVNKLNAMKWSQSNQNVTQICHINISFPILPSDGRFCILWNWYFWRKLEIFLPITNVIVCSHWVFWGKRRVTIQHFVEHHPETPPITLGPVPVTTEHLGSDVVRSSDGRVRQLSPPPPPTLRFAFW